MLIRFYMYGAVRALPFVKNCYTQLFCGFFKALSK